MGAASKAVVTGFQPQHLPASTWVHAASVGQRSSAVPLPRKPDLPADDTKDRQVFLSRPHSSAILAGFAEHSPRYYALVSLLYRTGMRGGEAAALRWNNVNLFDSTI